MMKSYIEYTKSRWKHQLSHVIDPLYRRSIVLNHYIAPKFDNTYNRLSITFLRSFKPTMASSTSDKKTNVIELNIQTSEEQISKIVL